MRVSQQISDKLIEAFSPAHMEVINESYQHKVAKNAESHFKVIIVSDFFNGKKLLARHRAVNLALASELKNDIHALAIHTYSCDEWANNSQVPNSPKCAGKSPFS